MASLRHILIWLLAALAVLPAVGQRGGNNSYLIQGIVRDSVTHEPIPLVSVATAGNASGTLTDDNGIFRLPIDERASSLQVACTGYAKKTVPISKGRVNLYDIWLAPRANVLDEVTVTRQKYTKKGNPAVEFARRIKEAGPKTDPRRHEYYSYDKYEITTLGLNDFVDKDENSAMFRKFPFLWDHVDTSEVSGKPILNVLAKEKASEIYYRKKPLAEKEVITGLKEDGVDEVAEQASVRTFLQDVLGEIDLYQPDVVILQNRFVSPLSALAPDFYRFYLADTVDVGGEKCIGLSFYPRNKASFGFSGQLFVPVGDPDMFIKKVTMHTSKDINLNFIENLYISQEYDRAPDGSRLLKRDDLTIELKVMPGTPGFYARRNAAYDHHSFQPPLSQKVFDKLGREIVMPEAAARDSSFWAGARLIAVSDNEKGVGDLMRKLRSVPLFFWTERVLKVMFTGYIATGRESKFDFGPVNTTISHNSVEGWRFRLGGMTTANLSDHWFARGYVAYALHDRRWKYKAELEHSFNKKEYHSREFPVHSIRLTSLYDLDQPGQHYMFTNPDNIFISLKRMKDMNVTYRGVNKLEYTLELRNNFSVVAEIRNEVQHATKHMPFVDGYGNSLKSYMESALKVELRYAPGEKFYQTKTNRVPVNLDAPVITLVHEFAPKGVAGSRFAINKTELSLQKRFWMSAFGHVDCFAKGGHVWSRSPFLSLMIPNANLSYTIQPESFALLNPMEFIMDSYAMWDVTYWANGTLLNYVPLVKKLKLREVASFRGFWGQLSRRNNPAFNPGLLRLPSGSNAADMNGTPYMEVSAGIDNIFKCLRIDYVWRLSHKNVPYRIDRHGLRIALHMTF